MKTRLGEKLVNVIIINMDRRRTSPQDEISTALSNYHPEEGFIQINSSRYESSKLYEGNKKLESINCNTDEKKN